MKTYIEYSFNMDTMKHKELHELCEIVWTPVENVNEFGRNMLAHRIVGVEDEWVSLYFDEIEEYLIDKENYEFCIGSDFDDCLWDDIIDSLLGDDDNYIGFILGSENVNWKLDSKFDFLNREWDCELYICGGDYHGDVAMVRRYYDNGNDDVVCVIGVSDSDLEKIEENDSMLEFIGNKLRECVIF